MYKDRFSENGQSNDHKQGCGWFSHVMGLVIATTAGMFVGLMIAPKSGEKLRDDMKEKADEMMDKVEEIFGEFTENFKQSYLDIKDNILEEINRLKDKASLTQERYREIVEDAVEDYFQDEKIPRDAIERLKKNFQRDWHELKKKLRG